MNGVGYQVVKISKMLPRVNRLPLVATKMVGPLGFDRGFIFDLPPSGSAT